jgi:hypothetical protein
VLVAGKVMVVASVPARVRELLAVSVLPSAIVSVAEVAGAVTATLLTDVAVATPNTGVTRVGEVASTTAPLPVEVVAPVPPEATGRADTKRQRRDEVNRCCDICTVVVEQIAVLPFGTVTPVWPATMTLILLSTGRIVLDDVWLLDSWDDEIPSGSQRGFQR